VFSDRKTHAYVGKLQLLSRFVLPISDSNCNFFDVNCRKKMCEKIRQQAHTPTANTAAISQFPKKIVEMP